VHLIGKTKRSELHPIRSERVRLDHVGAGPGVGLVHFSDQIGLGQVELVERAVQKNPAAVQHRPHCAVAHEHALVQFGQKTQAVPWNV
jgi:hypothetical protein